MQQQETINNINIYVVYIWWEDAYENYGTFIQWSIWRHEVQHGRSYGLPTR